MAVYNRDTTSKTKTKNRKTTEAKKTFVEQFRAEAEKRAEEQRKREEERLKKQQAAQIEKERRERFAPKTGTIANYDAETERLRRIGGAYGQMAADARSLIPGAAKLTLSNKQAFVQQTGAPIKNVMERNPAIQQGVMAGASAMNALAQMTGDKASARATQKDYDRAMRNLQLEQRTQRANNRKNPTYRLASDYNSEELSWMAQQAQMATEFEAERAARSARDPRLTGGNIYGQQNATQTMERAYRRAEDADASLETIRAAQRYRSQLDKQADLAGIENLRNDPSFRSQSNLGKVRYDNYLKGFDAEESLRRDLTVWLDKDQRENFYALYVTDPERARQYGDQMKWHNYQESLQDVSEFAGKNPLTRIPSWELGRRLGQAAGFSPFSEKGRMMTMAGEALLGGSAQGLQKEGLFNTGLGAGTINLPVFGEKGLGDVSQILASMANSYENAMFTAGFGALGEGMSPAAAKAIAKFGEYIGLALMGSQAAASDYADLMNNGVDQKTAILHATAAGIAEGLFEKLSLDNIIQMGTGGGLKTMIMNWFKQKGIEASEEMFTSLANRITDELIMDTSSYRSAVDERKHELMMNGMSWQDANSTAEHEWLTELMNDGLGGWISGGGMTAINYTGAGLNNLRNRINTTNEIRYNVGSRLANDADLTAALNDYAAQNKLAGISAADIETTKAMNERLTKQVTGEQTKTEGQQQTKAEKRQQATETKAARRVGKQASAILDNIAKRMDNKTMREYEQDAVSVMEQNKKLRQMVENEAYYRSLELYSRAKDLKTLDQFHSDNAKGVKDEGLRKAALNAYQNAAERMADTNDTAARATRTARQILHNGALDLSASYESDGETKRATIQRFADDTSKVILDNGETRSIEDLDLDQDTVDILKEIQNRELSATNANDVLNWYQMSVQEGNVNTGYAFVDDFVSAMDKGRNNSATEAKVVQRYSDLGERAAKAAYSIGRNAAIQAAKAAQTQRDNARQTYKAGDTVTTDTVSTKWKGATGREGKVDMSSVKGMTLDAQQAQQIALATGLARALGADVEVIASKLVDGKYVGHQGSYSNGKIQIDINAGRLYEGDLQSGVLKTMSHELTHFIQDYSPEQYHGLKDFAFEILGQKLGMDSFEDLVDSKIARSKDGISRLEAEDEVLADACETMLRDSKAVEQLYKQNTTLADNILNWLADFISKVRLNLGPADHEEARIIDALEKDLRAAFQERWDNALADAAQAHSEIGELENGGESKHSTRSLMEATGFDVTLEGGRVVAYDANGNRVTKVTPEHIKQSGYGAMIDYAQNVTKVISAADAKKQRQGLADLMNLMLKAQDGEMVWKFAGASLFSAVRTNSDGQYGTTIDFSTVCRKTQEMMDAMSEDMVELGRGLSKEEVTQLQKKIFEAGGTVPCPVCYVFSRWAGVGQILDNIKKFQEKYDHSWDDAKKLDDRIQFLTKATKTKADMRAALMEYDLHYQDLSLEVDHAKDENAQLKRKRTGLNKKKGVDVTAEVAEINKQIARNEAIIKANTEEMKELEKDGTPELAWLKRVRCHEDKNNKGHYLPNEDYWEHGFVGDAKTVTTSNQDLFDLTKADRFAEQYPLAWGYRTTRGPSAGKAILPYSDMRLGDLVLGPGKNSAQGKQTFASVKNGLNNDQRKAMESAVERTKAQNLIGGQRFQSTSDFRYDYGVDYLQAFFELQALGGKMQTYTKIVEFAEMVGAMGGDVNLSVMPLGKGVDKNGNLIYSSVTGIDYETAKSIAHAYDSAQLILVGINDEHINAALDDNAGKGGIEVGFVIPYHASGASINEFIRALVSNLGEDFVKENYKDYSKLQTDSRKKITGAKAETVKGWLDAMRENPDNPAFQGRRPNARQLAELRRMFKQEIRSAILRRTAPSAYKMEGETVEDAAARFLDSCQNMIAGESKDISGMSFDELRSIEKAALDGDADAIAEYESWSAGVLADLYNKMWVDESRDDTYGVTLTKAQAEAIMPHEYWNKEVDRAHAYVNGFIFRSYCYSMGLIPRFTGLNSDGADMGYGDFSENTGYWKTLIDRAMYANDGSYREQQAINVTNISEKLNEDTNILDPRYAQEKYGDKKVREPSAVTAHKAAQAFLEDVRKKEGKVQYSERDTEYLSLAKDPEKNRARLQELVDEAAEKAGYNSPNLYHGTSAPFTIFDRKQIGSATGAATAAVGFYLTDSEQIAEKFSQISKDPIRRAFGVADSTATITKARVRFESPFVYESVGNVDSFKVFSNALHEFAKERTASWAYPVSDTHNLDEMPPAIKREIGQAFAKKMTHDGYDGIIIRDTTMDGKTPHDFYVAFSSSQIKSADPVTYDDDGNVIPLSERFNPEQDDIRYSERDADTLPVAQDVVDAFADRLNKADRVKHSERDSMQTLDTETSDGEEVRFSLREKPAPKNTKTAYKLMRLIDGNLYPLFIGNNEKIKIGTWYDAESPNLSMLKDLPAGTHMINMETGEAITFQEYLDKYVPGTNRKKPNVNDIHWANDNGYRFMYIEDKAGTSSANRMQKQYGDTRAYYNWGVNGSAKSETGEGSASIYALRPGWHFGEVPSMHQIGYGDEKETRLDNQVWVEVQMAADVDYNDEAASNYSGDIPTHIPVDGYYTFATNPTQKKTKAGTSESDRTKADWYVAGAFTPVRILSDSEADAIVQDYNKRTGASVPLDHRRAGGGMFNADTMRVERKGDRYSERDISEIQSEYEEALESGDPDWQMQLVGEAAYAAGYKTGAYHGSQVTDITVFNTRSESTKKERLQLLFGTHFTRNKEYAKIYARKARNSKGTSRMTQKTGRVYDVYLDLGKSLDLEAARNYKPGTDIYRLYEDMPDRIKRKVPELTFSAYDTEQGLGSGKYVNTGTIEKALQAMTPKEATDFLVDHGYNSVLYLADYSTGMANNWMTRDPSIIMLDAERIKSADPVTYDDSGNPIPLSERFNTEQEDIRYSEREQIDMENRAEELRDQLELRTLLGLSDSEIRKAQNELTKLEHQLARFETARNARRRKTSFNDILRNLENYDRKELEHLANEASQYAWDDIESLSDKDLKDGLREMLTTQMEDLSEAERGLPKYGYSAMAPISVVRYSERDESLLSDNRVLIEADESVAQNEEQRRMLKEYKAQAKKIAELTEKLEDAKRNLKVTDRRLNTRGIPTFVANTMKEMHIGDAKNRNLAKNTTEILTNAYADALNALDYGKGTDAMMQALYDGASEVADMWIENGTDSQKYGYKWETVTLERLTRDDAEYRQAIIDEIVGRIYTDFAMNRYREAIKPTAADRIVERTAQKYQKQLDSVQAENKALSDQKTVAEKELGLYKRLEKDALDRAKALEERLTEAKETIKTGQKDSEKADATIARLEARLKEARDQAKQWKAKAQHGGVLARQMVESKNRDIQDIRNASDKAIAAKVKELQSVERDLAKQLQREEDILTGKLKPPAMQAMLKNAREEIRKKKDAKIYEMRESKNKKEMLRRITNLRKDLVNRIMKPTDRSYVPAELAQSLVDVLDILNMSPTPGTKGAEKYSSVSEAIHKMASAYAKMATQEDSLLKDDFDKDLHGAITALEDALSGIRVQDLSSAEMRDVYDKVKRIRDYLRDANKMIGKENAATIREYGDRIISEQNKIEARKKGYRKVHSLINELTSGAQINALSAMRAIKMIGGWTEDSALYELWKDIENGNEIRSNVVMDSNKTMQPLRTGRNEKTYMNALHNKLDYGIKDTKGKLVKMTKLQAIQLYMTWQREATSDKLSHLQKGFVEIRDANLMIKGKINSAERTAQRFKMTPEIAKKLFDSFSDWDKAYMKAARDVFHRILEDSNNVMYALRHTVMPGEDMYVPIVVDRNYLTTEVNEAEATQIGVKNPGSTKPLENNSTKPVIIDGLDTVLNKHITDMSAYIGLAVPIRNFVKAWNVTSEVSPDEKVSVKDAITKAWGGSANQMMMDVLRQIQNVKSNDYKTGFDRFSQKLAGYFAKSALVGRVSVVAKQAASYAAGGSVLSQAALNSAQQYILPIFASPNSKMAQSIYARADRLTPELYNRRQGMSMVEIANERLRGGMIRQTWDKAGASMEQSKIGRGARRALNALNPYDWIQRMDVATTTALFVACEHQAKMEKLTPNTPEFDSRVRELYNRVIRETQPMYDPLYRNQLQKSKAGGVLQAAFPFKTVPFQNYGQIMDSIGSWQDAMRSGTKEQKTKAAKHMGATIFANFMSALVFAGLTVLGNGVAMHKMKKWRDDDDELTPESFMLQYSKDVGSVMLSNILPYGGSELMEIIERIGTDKNSYFDIFSVGSIELINDTVNSIIKTINKWQDDDASEEDKVQQTAEMIFQVTTMFGMPARNIRDVANGVKANIQDIRNGNLPAFNNDVDRTNTVNANRYYKAVMSGDTGKAEAVLDEMRANTSGTQKEINQKVRGAINDRVKEAYQNGEMDLDGYISFLENTGLWEPDALADKAAKAVNELYTEGTITEDEAIALLGKYKGMDEDEAWFKVQEWADKNQAVQDALDAGLDADQAEDVSSSDYRHIYEAIDNNADIGGLVDELTSHGKKRDDVIRAAKDHIVEGYEKGEYDEAKFKNMLSRYCGITKRDEVTDILTKANCYKDTGYRLANVPSLYKEGDITKEKAREIMQKYGKLSKEDADKKIRWYDLQKSKPDLDITESSCNNWYDGTSKSRENGHEGAKAAGMSIETYLKVKAALADVKDANDNGTGEDEYIAALAKMNLTARQKDALYYEKYKGTTKYSKKPW